MFFFSHLYISKALYRYFAGGFELNQRAFAYGNIKPDLPSKYHCHHTLENCLFTAYHMSNRLLDEETDKNERSVILGEICHYVCDFFCYCHLNEELHNKKLKHLIYEVKLHFMFHKSFPEQRFMILPSQREPRLDITSIILELRKKYISQTADTNRDITYSLLAVTWVCESIIYGRKNKITQEMNRAMPAIIYKI